MLTLKQRIAFASALILVLLSTIAAQEAGTTPAQSSSLTVTAAAANERVRITAPASVLRMHVEVYAAGGEKLFDQEIRGGNVSDWHLQDGQAQRLAPGSYVCVVTAKSVSGRITQRIGTVSIEEKSVSVQAAESPQLSAAQAQAIGPVEENSSWTVSGKEEPQTPTVIAHDGTDGQMIRGRGALTFRIGNFFTGNDREQMRLTEDGRLGIGTNDPRATLDVAGTIRAQRFLIVKPKAEAGKSAQEYLTSNATEPEELLLTGTGTQNRIAKWIDNAGTLGDSAIAEVSGNVGIGTTAPGSKLVVSANASALPSGLGIARFADADGMQTAVFADAFGTNPIFNVRRANGTAAAPSAVQANQLLGVIGASGYGSSAYMGTRARVGFFASQNWTDTANGTYLTFNTTANGMATAGGTERMRIANNGYVGIGTTNPQYTLHVDGGTSSTGVYGRSTGGNGVYGHSESGIGLSGFSAGGVGWGVHGRSDNVGSNGVYGYSIAGNGVMGQSSNAGMGVAGYSYSGHGVYGQSFNGNGVYGQGYHGYAGYFDGRVTVSGTVGIGTANPQYKLHVEGGNNAAGVFGRSNSGSGVFGYSGDGRGVKGESGSGIGVYGTSTSGLAGYFEGRVNVNGNLGIGTSEPQQKLHLSGPDSRLRITSTSAGSYTEIQYQTDWRMWNTGVGGSAVTSPVNGKYYVYDASAGEFRLAIDTTGRVGIGTLTPDQRLSVNGDASKTGSGSWLAFSDQRLKNIKGNFTPGLNAVMQLQPLRYEYKRDNALNLKSDAEYVGFSAQSVQRVIPDAVTKNDQGYLLVNNDPILWTMLNAIKEQQAQIQQQQKQIDELKKFACRAHRGVAVCK